MTTSILNIKTGDFGHTFWAGLFREALKIIEAIEKRRRYVDISVEFPLSVESGFYTRSANITFTIQE